jgi:GT2 family glycosyltransferase
VESLSSPRNAQMRIVQNKDNLGIALGNNQGIELALADGCDWVLLLNNDTVLPPSLLEDLIASAVRNNAEILSPLIAAAEPAGTIWYSGGLIRSALRAYQPTHQLIGRPLSEAPKSVQRTLFAPACCLLVSPAVFASIGMMDPIYFVYYDDLDFAIRANRAGHRYLLDPTIEMLHKASSLTGGPESAFSLRWMSRNWIVVVRRYSSGFTLFAGVAFIAMWAIARAAVRRDSFSTFRKRLRGYIEGLRLPLALDSRPGSE